MLGMDIVGIGTDGEAMTSAKAQVRSVESVVYG